MDALMRKKIKCSRKSRRMGKRTSRGLNSMGREMESSRPNPFLFYTTQNPSDST